MVEGEATAHAIVWPGMGARMRSMHRIRLGAGASTIELRHEGEAVYAVLDGDGGVHDGDDGTVQQIGSGSMVHVEPGTAYRLVAGPGGLDLVGGPCPADPALYDGSGA